VLILSMVWSVSNGMLIISHRSGTIMGYPSAVICWRQLYTVVIIVGGLSMYNILLALLFALGNYNVLITVFEYSFIKCSVICCVDDRVWHN
jgi:hypothetical protein